MGGSVLGAGGDADALTARRRQRARRILLATGWLMVLVGSGWALFFLGRGARGLAVVELALMLLGGTVVLAAQTRRTRLAAWLTFAGLFVFLCFFCAVLDVPTVQSPRTTHLFLLVLAAGAHYVFRAEPARLRYGTVAVFMLAFIYFAAGPVAAPGPYAMGQDVRQVGIWFNLLSVAISAVVILHLQESDATAHRALHAELRDGLAARQFELFYQPQINGQGQVVGAEALLRWHHPVRGLAAPGEFMVAAEETGFILPLGQWVLAEASAQLARWQGDPHLQGLQLSVNVSALQLRQPEFVEQVLDALARSGADGQRLTLELTESVLLEDVYGAAAKMRSLRDAGVGLSLDDFGTGYGSLTYLHQMPFTELKIDRGFVSGMASDPQANSIARNLIRLGQDLGISVIAEGVETAEEYTLLRGYGCERFQGYLFGRPVPAMEFQGQVRDAALPALGRRGADTSPATGPG
jgi:EAL domain-containing protein (putative c-di-GMP-specific phosphodiesterase class I)